MAGLSLLDPPEGGGRTTMRNNDATGINKDCRGKKVDQF